MNSSVVFSDLHNHTSWELELDSSDELMINDEWHRPDSLLVSLSAQEPFVGRTTWSDLDLLHYQILIMKCFDLLSRDKTPDSWEIRHREPYPTFRFFAAAIIRAARLAGITGFDKLEITRSRVGHISIDFRKTLVLDWDSFVPSTSDAATPKSIFTVVVDNTR